MINLYQNILSHHDLEKLKSIVFSNNFPWYFVCTAYNETGFENINSFSYSHSIMENKQITSGYYEFFLQVFDKIMLKTNQNRKLSRIRLGCIGVTSNQFINDPHIDCEEEHTVGLLYLSTCDAPTYLYNERFDLLHQYKPKNEMLTLAKQ
jgi:hypothetical protein